MQLEHYWKASNRMDSPIRYYVDNGGIRFYPDAGDKKDELLDELRRTNKLLALQVKLLGELASARGINRYELSLEVNRIMEE